MDEWQMMSDRTQEAEYALWLRLANSDDPGEVVLGNMVGWMIRLAGHARQTNDAELLAVAKAEIGSFARGLPYDKTLPQDVRHLAVGLTTASSSEYAVIMRDKYGDAWPRERPEW